MELVNKRNVTQSGAPSEASLLAKRFTARGRVLTPEDIKFIKAKEGIPFYDDLLILFQYFLNTHGRKATKITNTQIALLEEMHLPNRGIGFLIPALAILGANPNNVKLSHLATPDLNVEVHMPTNLGTLFLDLRIITGSKDNYSKLYLATRLLNKQNLVIYKPLISVLIQEVNAKYRVEDLLLRTNGSYIDTIVHILTEAGIDCEGIPLTALDQP